MTDMGQPGGKTLFDLGWLIGIIDGEGSYVLTKQYHHKNKTLYFFPSLEITNTNQIIIDKVSQVIKDLFKVGVYINTYKTSTGKLSFKASLRGVKRLHKSLPLITACEISKKEQAELLLEYVQNRMTVNRGTPVSDRDIEIAIRLRELNDSKNKNITKDIPKKLK